ncbi:MAG TPA: VPLPA-CTERM sorting domain-containing protein [Gammaproteobacteria bacterium]|nr:VPLPA-CTERM sorting domain-containing protein [Gammaproteobacteria bacterium]
MNLSKLVKSMGIVAAVGAAPILSSTTASAALLTFAEGNQSFDSSVTSSFTLDLVADGLLTQSFGGGINITFDQSVVNVVGATFDPFWNFSNTEAIDNATGNYEVKISHFSLAPNADTVRQKIATIEFNIVGDGAFNFGFEALAAVGNWTYTPDLAAVGVNDKTYCLTTVVAPASPATCLDAIPDPAGRELLTLSPTSVSVASTVVPVPAAVWLFGSGLIGLVGVSRRKAA